MLVAFKHLNTEFLNTVCIPTVYKNGVRFPMRVSEHHKKICAIDSPVPKHMYKICAKKPLKDIL